jgi:hypothetical protein
MLILQGFQTLNVWCELPIDQIGKSESRASQLQVEKDQEVMQSRLRRKTDMKTG